MKVQCGQCPAKYAIADERFRDKKVRIRCRRCNAAIVVDGKVTPPLVTSTPARRSARPASSLPPESALPSSPEADSRPSPRPVAHTIMGGLEAPVARQLLTEHVAHALTPVPKPNPRAGMPEPDRGFTEPPARDTAERWRVALTQQDLRWMTTEEITQAFRDGAVKSETFVFRAGMPTWVTLFEVSEIAQALADAGLVSPPQPPLPPLNLDENESRPSSPPRRISSLPPPRKPVRQRGAAVDDAPDGSVPGEAASDLDESLPFALVPERVNGAKKPADAPDALPVEPTAGDDTAALATPLIPATAEALATSAAPTPPLAAALAAVEPAPEPAPAPTQTPPQRSAGLWIGLALALLLAAAAVFFFGPHVGLRVR